MNAGRLSFTLASPTDAHEIFDLVYLHPDPFLRAVTLEDVKGWIANGASWIVRDLATSRVVGVCNIRVPETTQDQTPKPAEFGGIFVHPDYRVRGVADALGVLAIASYFWDNDPDVLEPLPLISHVHVKNENPLKLLDRLGFVFDKIEPVPDGVPGFEHMPREEDGRLLGKEFHFPPQRRSDLFRKMAELLSTAQFDGFAVEIEPAIGMEPGELERLANLLGNLRTNDSA